VKEVVRPATIPRGLPPHLILEDCKVVGVAYSRGKAGESECNRRRTRLGQMPGSIDATLLLRSDENGLGAITATFVPSWLIARTIAPRNRLTSINLLANLRPACHKMNALSPEWLALTRRCGDGEWVGGCVLGGVADRSGGALLDRENGVGDVSKVESLPNRKIEARPGDSSREFVSL
jgi:hypothetical protein